MLVLGDGNVYINGIWMRYMLPGALHLLRNDLEEEDLFWDEQYENSIILAWLSFFFFIFFLDIYNTGHPVIQYIPTETAFKTTCKINQWKTSFTLSDEVFLFIQEFSAQILQCLLAVFCFYNRRKKINEIPSHSLRVQTIIDKT